MSFLLYGIITDGGLAQAPDGLTLLTAGSLCAVAAECAEADQEIESLLAFGDAIAAIHQQTTIIPIRYGTLLPDAAAVTAHLETLADHYRRRLDELRGCEEIGIRLPMAKPAPIPAKTPPARNGREYLQSLKRKYSATEQAETQTAALNLALKGLYRQQRAETGLFNGEPSYLVSYLVPRENLPAFREKLDQISQELGLKSLISGPWPPYNFA